MTIELIQNILLISIDNMSNFFFLKDKLKKCININEPERCNVNVVVFDIQNSSSVNSVMIDLMVGLKVLKYKTIICAENIEHIKELFSIIGIYNSFIYCASLQEAQEKFHINFNGGNVLWVKKAEQRNPDKPVAQASLVNQA